MEDTSKLEMDLGDDMMIWIWRHGTTCMTVVLLKTQDGKDW
jgi:hypothetical protein